jgi:hypothetical protein
VTSLENVNVSRTLLENAVINVWLDFINILNACRVIAIHMAQMELRAIMMVSAIASITSMEKLAMSVKKISITIRSVRVAIVIQPVSSLNLLVVGRSLLENFVSARSVFKEEFAISVAHFIGI